MFLGHLQTVRRKRKLNWYRRTRGLDFIPIVSTWGLQNTKSNPPAMIGKLSKAKSSKANFPEILSTFFAPKHVPLISQSVLCSLAVAVSQPRKHNIFAASFVDAEADSHGYAW